LNEAKREKVLRVLSQAEALLTEIEEKLKATLLCFICHKSITHQVAYRLNKIIRKCPKEIERLAVLIDSGGGDIDATAKVVKLLRSHCKKYIAIIPFFAKSAATLLPLNAEEIIMCKSAELGPVDPQVQDPVTKLFVPASSIKLALDFIQETKDPFVKLSMADKIPPLLMGAYRGAQNVSRQYIEEACEKLGNKKEEAVHTFTDKYLSHGYPIDIKICEELDLPVKCPDESIENKIHELHEIYIDLLIELANEEEDIKKKGEHLIIQTKDKKCVIVNDEEILIPTEEKVEETNARKK